MRWLQWMPWMMLASTTSVSAQVIEQVEGETIVRSEDGGQMIAVELPGGVLLDMVWSFNALLAAMAGRALCVLLCLPPRRGREC
jgi:hypothetical protein